MGKRVADAKSRRKERRWQIDQRHKGISAEQNLAIEHVAKRSLALETDAVGGVHFYRLLRGEERRVVGSHPIWGLSRGITTRSSQWRIQQRQAEHGRLPSLRDCETRVTITHERSSRFAPEIFMGTKLRYCRITGSLSSASAPLPSDKPSLVRLVQRSSA